MSKSASGTIEPAPEDPPSYRVIQALATARGCDPLDLEPVGRYIDLECLDDLVESAGDELVVRVTVNGDRVEVRGDGTVRIR